MEKKIGQSFFIVLLVLELFAGQSAAKFEDCYKVCMFTCVLDDGKNAVGCAAKCLKHCIVKPHPLPASLDHHVNTNYFCKLGCAFTMCTELSTKEDPAEKKVEGCVNSCSETCPKI